jgi:sterol desaturase/sphingolipid hydroxylase (fatty acid hydroxylase superfamily)
MSPVNVYAVVSPAILALVLAEFLYCLYQGNGYYTFDDSLANFATAIGHQVTNVFVAFVMFLGFDWTQRTIGLFTIRPTFLSWALLYLGVDFLFYWFHRAGHSINLLWAAHAPHHSSEELNYTVAIRASLTQRAASFFFYWPLAVLGFPAWMIVPMVAVHLVLQFLPHTRAVRRLGFLETFLNCPTHHRVHHAINPQYLNRNMGGTLIVWDKLFGTYEPEVEECAYGVTPPLRTWNPIKANLQFFAPLWRDMLRTRSWWDKLRLGFMPLGWRPADLSPEPPEPPVRPGTQAKYRTEVPRGRQAYLLAQLPVALLVMLTVTRTDSPLDVAEKVAMGALIWVAMVSWGGLLEGRGWADRLELPKLFLFVGASVTVYAGQSWTSPRALAIVATGLGFAAAYAHVRRAASPKPALA